MNLNELGWNAFFEDYFKEVAKPTHVPARVAREHTHIYVLYSEQGEVIAQVSGKLRHEAICRSDFPTVGDWVVIEPHTAESKATIHAVLPRKGSFIRKEAGGVTQEQVVAANVDTVFLVAGLDGDFNPRRIERYLTVAWDSGAKPVIVLNKADCCPDVWERVAEVEGLAFGTPVLAVSATENDGVDGLRDHIGLGETAVFLGSSGVGKSTIINALVGEAVQDTGGVREDDSRGRHTTTHRELILLDGGGVLMDTPGMRELQLWSDEGGVDRAFADIEALAEKCRFRDCAHENEPGCAVVQALDEGALERDRWQSYLKLKRELRHMAARQDAKERLAERTREKAFGKMQKQAKKNNKKTGGGYGD